jgi:hypothetical protein
MRGEKLDPEKREKLWLTSSVTTISWVYSSGSELLQSETSAVRIASLCKTLDYDAFDPFLFCA